MLYSSVLSESILVGREHELDKLESLLNAAFKGKGATVFLFGEAGSGKSRIVREFLVSAKNKGANILVGWCLSDAAVPYFPFIEVFNTFFDSMVEPAFSDVTSWLSGPKSREKMSGVEPLSPQVWKDQAFDRVAKTLLTIAAEKPLVLILEDVHWADSASLSLLHYISRVVNNTEKILVLATFRSEEVTVDAEGRFHPLEEEMKTMSREDLFSEIKLLNLNQTHYSAIAQNMLGDIVEQNLIDTIVKEGNGNALFLIESLRLLVERKGLIKENGEWRLAVGTLEIPSKIRDIILHRLGGLKYSQRRILDAASVIGEKFNAELLASVLKQDFLDVLENLNFIAKSTAIVSDEGGYYRFDHARSREVLYETLSSSLRTGYHARIGEKIESENKNGNLPFADLAHHYAQAGNDEKAIKYSLEAGQQALTIFSNGEAIRNFQYVLDKLPSDKMHIDQRTIALEGLGDALYANSNFCQARETFEKLAQLQFDKAKLRALRKAIIATFYEINPPKIKELTYLAEEYASKDRVEAARILSHKARICSVEGKYVDSIPFLQEAIRAYEEEYCLADAAWDLFAIASGYAWSNRLEEGIACALRSIAMHDDIGDLHARLEAHLYAANCFGYCTFGAEAAEYYKKVIEIDNTFKINDYVRLVPACLLLGGNLSWENPKAAKELGLRALEYCNKSDSAYRSIGSVYAFLAGMSILEGEIEQGEEYYEKYLASPSGARFNPLIVYPMSAIYFASKNRFNEAHEYIAKLLEFNNQFMPCPGLEIIFRLRDAWILKKEGRLDKSREITEQVQILSDNVKEKFAHVDVYCGLMTLTHPEVNQIFGIRLDVVNVSTCEGKIVGVDNLLSPALKVLDVSSNCILKDEHIEFKEKNIDRFSVKTIKLTVSSDRSASINIQPTVTYADGLGQTKTSTTRLFQINVQPISKQDSVGKITTGLEVLDQLLLGGIPEGSAIALTASNSNESCSLIKRYIEAGLKNNQMTFYVADYLQKGKDLAKEYPSDMYLFVCTPKVDSTFSSLPNVVLLNGFENLTAIDIALTKVLRLPSIQRSGSKRVCIEIASDVLLQHHALITRKWLSGLIQEFKSNGFTIFVVFDPSMHPPEELQAVLSIFDGEIHINERENPQGIERMLKVKKLINQKFSSKEIVLSKETLND
jgi:tetratricopeptide (TPR) repeat protein